MDIRKAALAGVGAVVMGMALAASPAHAAGPQRGAAPFPAFSREGSWFYEAAFAEGIRWLASDVVDECLAQCPSVRLVQHVML